MSPTRSALVRPKLDYPRVPYHGLLRRTVERCPDKWATVFHDRMLTFRELEGLSNALANGLRALGVGKGDRVALFMTNRPEYLVSFEATSKVGGTVTPINPAYHAEEVEYQLNDSEARVLIVHEERYPIVAAIRANLTTVRHVLVIGDDAPVGTESWDALVRDHPATAPPEVAIDIERDLIALPYSSGTTGLPKPIVHPHGGMVLVAMATALHLDVAGSYGANNFGERFHWYSSTGWVMWNCQVAGLLSGTTCVIFDGSPGGSRDAPDWTTLWRFAARHGVTFLGGGAAMFANCAKAGVDLAACGDLSSVRALGTTGSPLAAEVQQWGTDQFRRIATTDAQRDIWWFNISGGTDFAGGFIGGSRELPQQAGVMQCRMLGAAVEAWNESGEPVQGQVGELVCTQPIPSMPLRFWNDPGNARYLASYFEMYPPGHGRKPGGGDLPKEAGSVWRHGDWLRVGDERGHGEWCVIYGRSDATINRQGLRMGTSEIYSAVEALTEVLDSMVVDLEYLGRTSYMPLFVVLRPGVALDDALKKRLHDAIRTALSPRFVPDAIFQVPEVPRTLSGKKQELPIKKLLLGQPIEKVVNQEAMANPQSLAWYVAFAASRNVS